MLVFHGTKDREYAPMVEQIARDFGLTETKCIGRGESLHGDGRVFKILERASFVLIWNGWQFNAPIVSRFCRLHGIPHGFVEWGMLPQSKTYMVDRSGFCGDSSMNTDLSWVTQEDVDLMLAEREKIRAQHPMRDGDHVLVPLQIQKDTQIVSNSCQFYMREFVDEVVERWPGTNIVIRPHPKSGGEISVSRWGGRVKVDEPSVPFLASAAAAGAVVGLTSTCLLEAAVMGKPVVALGNCPLGSHPAKRHDVVAAAALAMSCPRNGYGMAERFKRQGCRPREII
jgi:hypothetical protein